MYLIRVMDMIDPDSFVNLIISCRGNVMLKLGEAGLLDLKGEPKILDLLRFVKPEREGLLISMDDPNDFYLFFNFLMRGKRV